MMMLQQVVVNELLFQIGLDMLARRRNNTSGFVEPSPLIPDDMATEFNIKIRANRKVPAHKGGKWARKRSG